jgi:hypothetical protein
MKKVALALATLALSFGMVAGMARAYPSPGEMLVQGGGKFSAVFHQAIGGGTF